MPRHPASTAVDAAAPDAPGAADAAAVPALLADTATTIDIAKAVNGISNFLKKDQASEKAPEQPASAPAAPKMGAVLHKVALADLAAKLLELKLDAIDLEGGGKLIYNAVTRQLRDEKGALAESGYYAAADGSYFNVSNDQYIYEISKPTYDSVYLSRVELADAKAKLAKEPGGKVIKLHGDNTAEEADYSTAKGRAVARLARVALTR